MSKTFARPAMSHVGREVGLRFDVRGKKDQPRALEPRTVFVRMGIMAPNGDTCFIFGRESIFGPGGGPTRTQARLVKAFMKQHNGLR